jgi:hypothetical protein
LSKLKIGSVETEHGHERVIDGPHFSGAQVSETAAESLNVHCPKPLDQNAPSITRDQDLWTERRRSCLATSERRRSDDDHP